MFRDATRSEDSPGTSRRRLPAARLALVRAAEEGARSPGENPQVETRRAMLHVPDVQLDPVGPRQRRAAVDLRPAGDSGLDVEPVTLALVVLLDLVAQRRPWADDAHLAPDDVPELRQFVERELPQQPPAARDPRVAAVHREGRAPGLRAAHDRAAVA